MNHDIEFRLRTAVIDRFFLLQLADEQALLPDSHLAESISVTLHAVTDEYTIICDARRIPDDGRYDATDFVTELCRENNVVILDNADRSGECPVAHRSAKTLLLNRDPGIAYDTLDVQVFDWECDAKYPACVSTDPPSEAEFEATRAHSLFLPSDRSDAYAEFLEYWDTWAKQGHPANSNFVTKAIASQRYLRDYCAKNGRNSLLTEFAMNCAEGGVTLTPYHARSLHSIETRSSLLVGRPAVLAKRTKSLLNSEISGLENTLAQEGCLEMDIQTYLEAHPQLLQAMGYRRVYAQVVLERSDGTSLRPDFMLEPIGSDWCDILDIKRPQVNVAVGRRDRYTLSAAIHELAAQLREYAAYFEDPRLARRVEDLFGIKCYRPKLIGVVGSDPSLADERQKRRLMTAYSDLSVVTFDQLLAVARDRLLI